MCTDHPEVQSLVGEIEDRRVITYGENPQADARLLGLTTKNGGSVFSVAIRDRVKKTDKLIEGIELPMPGTHNALNATAAIAVADQLGIDETAIREGLKNFSGVKRRFTRTGLVDGISVIDDYAHHPVEIAAVLRAARSATERDVIAVVQPHRYSRLHDLMDDFAVCFNDADTVIVAPVFSAGEAPIDGVSHEELVARLRAKGHRDAQAIDRPELLASVVSARARAGDYVVCLGAGSITQWAAHLPGQIESLRQNNQDNPDS
jgi:UDP-N-acetylmuramate--alanine ligase